MNKTDNGEMHQQMKSFATKLVQDYFQSEINQPDPLESADSKRDRKIEEFTSIFESHNAMIQQASEIYKTHDKHGIITPIIDKVENGILADFQNPDFLTDKDYEILMTAAVEAYNTGDHNTALRMAAYVAHIFPLQVQPYILMTTVYWAQEGAQKAAQIYDHLKDVLPNPMLYLYAARCFVAAEERSKAVDILQRAQKMIETDPDTFITLRDEVLSELDTISQHK